MSEVVIVGCGSGMGVGKTMMVALIMTDMHLSACEQQINQFEEPQEYKIENLHIPEPEFDYSRIKKHELDKLHPFHKFMGNKRKGW